MAHVLDDLGFVTRLDPKGMYGLTADFADQCRRALEISQKVQAPKIAKPQVVVLSGLGGSAAGGDFTKALFDAQSDVPFIVNRDYHLPSWVDSDTLVFCASYSGNTEETLSAYADAQKVGARVIAVTSGGKLAELAAKDGHTAVIIPGGQPPRTALGYMMIPTIYMCSELGLLPGQDFATDLATVDTSALEWGVDAPYESNVAKQLGQTLHGKLSVLYGLGGWQAIVANRWKGQINENAKNMTFSAAFPELNHNEILGWVKANEQGVASWVTVILEDGTESAKMKARAAVTSNLIKGQCEIVRIHAPGQTLLSKMLNLTLLGDFVSLYLAALNGVDPENIDSINTLKNELSKVS